MVKYLALLYETFGLVALRRPIRLLDLTKVEQEFFWGGDYQLLPYRDWSGRRVACIVTNNRRHVPHRTRVRSQHQLSQKYETYWFCLRFVCSISEFTVYSPLLFLSFCVMIGRGIYIQLKVLLYLWTVAAEDDESQHKGLVAIIYSGPAITVVRSFRMSCFFLVV